MTILPRGHHLANSPFKRFAYCLTSESRTTGTGRSFSLYERQVVRREEPDGPLRSRHCAQFNAANLSGGRQCLMSTQTGPTSVSGIGRPKMISARRVGRGFTFAAALRLNCRRNAFRERHTRGDAPLPSLSRYGDSRCDLPLLPSQRGSIDENCAGAVRVATRHGKSSGIDALNTTLSHVRLSWRAALLQPFLGQLSLLISQCSGLWLLADYLREVKVSKRWHVKAGHRVSNRCIAT